MAVERRILVKCEPLVFFDAGLHNEVLSTSSLTIVMCILRYAMKCLDKKRIKMKQGETLALNERIMLSLVSTGVSRLSWSSDCFCQDSH